MELKGVIRELINEMWYGSKNDAEGDETHDEPLNEILSSYDKMIEFVKSLPTEEQNKIAERAKQIGASAAVIEYLDNLSKELSQKTFDKIGEVCYSIKNEEFEKNEESCFSFGRKCVYWNYCRNGSMKNLVKLEDK